MKCPKCKGEMEEGVLGDAHGNLGNRWAEAKWGNEIGKILPSLKNGRKITMNRCVNCGFLESYAK